MTRTPSDPTPRDGVVPASGSGVYVFVCCWCHGQIASVRVDRSNASPIAYSSNSGLLLRQVDAEPQTLGHALGCRAHPAYRRSS